MFHVDTVDVVVVIVLGHNSEDSNQQKSWLQNPWIPIDMHTQQHKDIRSVSNFHLESLQFIASIVRNGGARNFTLCQDNN